jgi:hypothetical protein
MQSMAILKTSAQCGHEGAPAGVGTERHSWLMCEYVGVNVIQGSRLKYECVVLVEDEELLQDARRAPLHVRRGNGHLTPPREGFGFGVARIAGDGVVVFPPQLLKVSERVGPPPVVEAVHQPVLALQLRAFGGFHLTVPSDQRFHLSSFDTLIAVITTATTSANISAMMR